MTSSNQRSIEPSKDLILFLTPTRGSLSLETHIALTSNTDGFQKAFLSVARRPVVEARNELARMALHAASQLQVPKDRIYCAHVDDDAYWPAHTLGQAVGILRARPDIDLLAGSFCTRLPFAPRIAYRKADDCESYPRPGVDCEMNSLVECEIVGLHFAVHRLDLLNKVGPGPFSTGEGCSEDFAFCRRVRKNGGKIYNAPGLIVGHIDPVTGACYVPGDGALRVENNRLVRTGLGHMVPTLAEQRVYGANTAASAAADH